MLTEDMGSYLQRWATEDVPPVGDLFRVLRDDWDIPDTTAANPKPMRTILEWEADGVVHTSSLSPSADSSP